MVAGGLETATLHRVDPALQQRQRAERTAQQFEELFVRSMVASLRQCASLGGDDDGLFGAGPGSDTYTDWFDQHLAGHLGRTGHIGIAAELMREFDRRQEIPPPPPAAPRLDLVTATHRRGVIDVHA